MFIALRYDENGHSVGVQFTCRSWRSETTQRSECYKHGAPTEQKEVSQGCHCHV